jgi:putative hydrolase of the HAD superfamily
MDEHAVSAVLFDLDSTLCVHPTPRADALAAAFERAGVDPFCSLSDLRQAVESYGETASMPYRIYKCCGDLAEAAGHDRETGIAVAAALRMERHSTDAELAPGARQLLERLDGDHSLALITNGGPDTQDLKLDALGIADYFETIVLAGFETPSKPDPAPFERALQSVDARPENAVYVGNSLDHDIAGAHAAGLDAVWVRNGHDAPDQHDPEYVVDELTELRPPPWESIGPRTNR